MSVIPWRRLDRKEVDNRNSTTILLMTSMLLELDSLLWLTWLHCVVLQASCMYIILNLWWCQNLDSLMLHGSGIDLLTAEFGFSHSKWSTSEKEFPDAGSVPFRSRCKPCHWASVHNTRNLEVAHWNGTCLLLLFIAPVFFFLRYTVYWRA